MREVEAKAVLRDREGMMKRLTEMSCVFSEPVRQEDEIFFPPGLHPPTPFGTNVLRLRREGTPSVSSSSSPLRSAPGRSESSPPRIKSGAGSSQEKEKTLFTLKRSISHLDKIEVETEVVDYDGMRRVIVALGYPTVVRVVKTRVKARVGETEICLDDVEHLGSFIEVERFIPDDGNGEVVTMELHAFLESLSVPKEDHTVTMGYDVLLYERGLVEQVAAL